MAEFPALPLWTDAYLGDTTHLNDAEHGSYLLLLIVAWRTATTSLPDDDVLLAKYARCSAKAWPNRRRVLEPFFEVGNGEWVQKRLRDEKSHLALKKANAAANGRLSALKRKERHATKREQSDQQSDQRNVNKLSTPTPTPTPTPILNSTLTATSVDAHEPEPPWDTIRLADELCRVAGVRNLEPGRILANVKAVREWIEAGADPPLIIATIQHGRDRAQNGIHALAYFDTRVRQAIARRDHPNEPARTDTSQIRDPLLRRYVENGGTLSG